MTPMQAILLALQASVWFVVIALGLRTPVTEFRLFVRRPGLLARSLVALFVLPPACAIGLNLAFPMPPTVRFALVALMVAPVAPGLARRQPKIGAQAHYVTGLLALAAAVSIVATPLLVGLAAAVLGARAEVSAGRIAAIVLISLAAPLALGVALNLVIPRAAATVGRIADGIGAALLLAATVALLVVAGPALVPLLGAGAVLAIAAVVSFALLAGHLLGGLGPEKVSAPLALAASSRHPGVAMAIAAASFPGQNRSLGAAVLLFILVNAVISALYAWWMTRRAAGGSGGAPAAAQPS